MLRLRHRVWVVQNIQLEEDGDRTQLTVGYQQYHSHLDSISTDLLTGILSVRK
jgi:hypothetical protein